MNATTQRKTFYVESLITLALYFIGFWILGLIANLYFLHKANEYRRVTADNPPGRTILLVLLWIMIIIPLILVVLAMMGVVALPFLAI